MHNVSLKVVKEKRNLDIRRLGLLCKIIIISSIISAIKPRRVPQFPLIRLLLQDSLACQISSIKSQFFLREENTSPRILEEPTFYTLCLPAKS